MIASFRGTVQNWLNLTLVADRKREGVERRHIGFVVDDRSRVIELAKAAGAAMVEGPFLDFLDPWGNRVEIVTYTKIQFTKADHVLRAMGLGQLRKTDEALAELRAKGMAPE